MAVAFGIPVTNVAGQVAITATPTTQTQAAGVVPTGLFNVATVANASDAITLPKGAPGQLMAFDGGANAAKLFPPVGGKVNGGTVDASFTLAASVITLVMYVTDIDVIAVQGAV